MRNVMRAIIRITPRFVRVSPIFFVFFMLFSLMQGLCYGVMAPVTQRFFDSATAYVAMQVETSAVIATLAVLGAAHAVKQVLNGVANFMYNMYMRKAEGVFALEIHEKIGRIDPKCFEDSKFLDSIEKADMGKDRAAWFMGSITATFNFYIPYLFGISAYLYSLKPLLVVSLLLVFTPTLLAQILRAKVFTAVEDKAAPVRREFDYYESCITGREYFKETRILGAFDFFRRLYSDSLMLLNRLAFRAAVKSDLAELGMKLLSLGGYIGVLFLLFGSLVGGEISVGAFAVVFASVDKIFSALEDMIVLNYGESARNFGMIQNYLRFLEMPERKIAEDERSEGELPEAKSPAADSPEAGDITLRGVSFSYPGAEQKAVDNVTLCIKRGETVAIVGENGSGKTTLVRLLTGLYLPDQGTATLHKGVSAVFQKYQRYQMTLRENIGISHIISPTDEESLDRCSAEAGIDKRDNIFAHAYDTMLSREFDGIDLSGGQWQRVAIARGFFRPHQFIVLDEPTAAIDPIEETKIYNRFAEISKGKTALIVTHRLGSVRLADRILVMKQGRLVEQGTHRELMERGGEYSGLYASQEQWYIMKEKHFGEEYDHDNQRRLLRPRS